MQETKAVTNFTKKIEMDKERLTKEIEKTLKRGFRFAYTSREGHSLREAMIYKNWATCKTAAEAKANNSLIENKVVKVWDLQKELLNLNRE